MMTINQSFSLIHVMITIAGLTGYVPLLALQARRGVQWMTAVYTVLVLAVIATVSTGTMGTGVLHGIGVMGVGLMFIGFTYTGRQRIFNLEKRVEEQGSVVVDGR